MVVVSDKIDGHKNKAYSDDLTGYRELEMAIYSELQSKSSFWSKKGVSFPFIQALCDRGISSEFISSNMTTVKYMYDNYYKSTPSIFSHKKTRRSRKNNARNKSTIASTRQAFVAPVAIFGESSN